MLILLYQYYILVNVINHQSSSLYRVGSSRFVYIHGVNFDAKSNIFHLNFEFYYLRRIDQRCYKNTIMVGVLFIIMKATWEYYIWQFNISLAFLLDLQWSNEEHNMPPTSKDVKWQKIYELMNLPHNDPNPCNSSRLIVLFSYINSSPSLTHYF